MTRPHREIRQLPEAQEDKYWDFYVLDTTVEDWDLFIATVPGWVDRWVFYRGADVAEMPQRFDDIVAKNETDECCLLSMWVKESMFNCHFFWDKDIELDFDPRDHLHSEEAWRELLAFLQRIVDLIGKRGIITDQGGQSPNQQYLNIIDELHPNP